MNMKKVSIILAISLPFLVSCTGKCDTSTVSGAAVCFCNLTDESVTVNKNNKEEMKAYSEKFQKVNAEIQNAIENGNYTIEEYKAELKNRGCM